MVCQHVEQTALFVPFTELSVNEVPGESAYRQHSAETIQQSRTKGPPQTDQKQPQAELTGSSSTRDLSSQSNAEL